MCQFDIIWYEGVELYTTSLYLSMDNGPWTCMDNRTNSTGTPFATAESTDSGRLLRSSRRTCPGQWGSRRVSPRTATCSSSTCWRWGCRRRKKWTGIGRQRAKWNSTASSASFSPFESCCEALADGTNSRFAPVPLSYAFGKHLKFVITHHAPLESVRSVILNL